MPAVSPEGNGNAVAWRFGTRCSFATTIPLIPEATFGGAVSTADLALSFDVIALCHDIGLGATSQDLHPFRRCRASDHESIAGF
jgi:hypothetical protein